MKTFRSFLFCFFVATATVLAARPMTPAPAHRFEISKVDLAGSAITVTNEHGEAKTYRLTNFTQILINNHGGTIRDLATGMSVQISSGQPGVAERVVAANGVLGAGDTATKVAPAESRVHIPATSVGSKPVIVGMVKAGQVVTIEPIKVYWCGGGSKSGQYCDWNGYPGSGNEGGHPWMAVVAAVGKDSHAPAGNKLSFTAAADGMLVVYANDDKPEGNVGSGDVTVKVQ